MEANYDEIEAYSITYSKYSTHLFSTSITSKNEVFRSMIQRLTGEWGIGENVESDILIEAYLTKYIIMVNGHLWNKKRTIKMQNC